MYIFYFSHTSMYVKGYHNIERRIGSMICILQISYKCARNLDKLGNEMCVEGLLKSTLKNIKTNLDMQTLE